MLAAAQAAEIVRSPRFYNFTRGCCSQVAQGRHRAVPRQMKPQYTLLLPLLLTLLSPPPYLESQTQKNSHVSVKLLAVIDALTALSLS
jgi:hypothetical protein